MHRLVVVEIAGRDQRSGGHGGEPLKSDQPSEHPVALLVGGLFKGTEDRRGPFLGRTLPARLRFGSTQNLFGLIRSIFRAFMQSAIYVTASKGGNLAFSSPFWGRDGALRRPRT